MEKLFIVQNLAAVKLLLGPFVNGLLYVQMDIVFVINVKVHHTLQLVVEIQKNGKLYVPKLVEKRM